MKSLWQQVILFFLIVHGFCWAQVELRFPQVPLRQSQGDVAIIFIGGLGDESTGIVHQLYRCCPPLADDVVEQRAYYHWNGDDLSQPWPHVAGVLADVLAFRQTNPYACIVLIGHSFGAVAALELAARVPDTYLITLDPVDRKSVRQRPKGVKWWGHAYVTHSASARDFIFASAGRWGHCPTADVSKNCDGRIPHELGRCYIHDYAYDMLMTRGRDEQSLLELLRRVIKFRAPCKIRRDEFWK